MPLDLTAVDRLVTALARQEAQVATPPTPTPEKKSVGPWPYIAMIGGHALDAGSTIDGFRRGLRETNPLIGQSVPRLVAMKAAGSIGTALMMRLLDKLDRPGADTAAKAIGYGTGAYAGAHGVRNLTLGRDRD